MKKYFIFLLLFISFGCNSKKDILIEEKILLGKIDRNLLNSPEYPWYTRNYNNYSISDSTITAIKNYQNGLKCIIFFGSWCSDSKREVPRFLKILDLTNFINYEIIGLGRDKKSPGGEEKGLNIQKVPTLIFIKDNKELGRIIENPTISLEQDFLNIISNQPTY